MCGSNCGYGSVSVVAPIAQLKGGSHGPMGGVDEWLFDDAIGYWINRVPDYGLRCEAFTLLRGELHKAGYLSESQMGTHSVPGKVPYIEGAVKPAKLVVKMMKSLKSKYRQMVETLPRPLTWSDHLATDRYQNWAETNIVETASQWVVRNTVLESHLHLSHDWPDDDTYYGDEGACFYPGRGYSGCGEAIARGAGWFCRITRKPWGADTEQNALGRCLVIPVQNWDRSRRGWVVTNLYNTPSGGWLTLQKIASFLAASIEGTAIKIHVKEGCKGGWFLNGGGTNWVVFPSDQGAADWEDGYRMPEVTDYTCVCSQCGEHCDNDDTTQVGDDVVCRDCIDNHYTYCEGCDEYAPNDNMHSVADWSDGSVNYRCECCIDNDSDIQPTPHWLERCCDTPYIDMGR